ncbi:MAG: hypothetical protein OXG88_00485 [Gammaproteobacteria bacterium]|nr:hypothetical protein [Gammaproteobacteria bacterium]
MAISIVLVCIGQSGSAFAILTPGKCRTELADCYQTAANINLARLDQIEEEYKEAVETCEDNYEERVENSNNILDRLFAEAARSRCLYRAERAYIEDVEALEKELDDNTDLCFKYFMACIYLWGPD